ncbi:MAG: hypothetical protein AB7F88_04025 [Pyrinomonadaceae bacterium]
MFNNPSDEQARQKSAQAYAGNDPSSYTGARRPVEAGRTAVWQARLVLLVMINIAQLWILSAGIEAALAREFNQLLPLIIASLVCWVIALTIFLWWKPAPKRRTSTGKVRE